MFKKALKSVYTSSIMVLLIPRFLLRQLFQLKENPDDPKPADEGNIQMKYFPD
jgi:hypothetical protein